jgi:hypothetical protein
MLITFPGVLIRHPSGKVFQTRNLVRDSPHTYVPSKALHAPSVRWHVCKTWAAIWRKNAPRDVAMLEPATLSEGLCGLRKVAIAVGRLSSGHGLTLGVRGRARG